MIISNRFLRALLLLTLALTVMPLAGTSFAQSPGTGTSKHPIIDSRMTETKAFEGLDPKCPADIRRRQKVVKLKYYSSDRKIHQGQLVLDGELKNDIKKVFALALKEGFPIYSVIPISDQRFRKDGRWDDELSMEANNTSAFNYREITGGGRLSNASPTASCCPAFFDRRSKTNLSSGDHTVSEKESDSLTYQVNENRERDGNADYCTRLRT